MIFPSISFPFLQFIRRQVWAIWLVKFPTVRFADCSLMILPCGSESKASACNLGDPGSIPGSGRSPGKGNGNPLQYSYLENPSTGLQRVGHDFTFTHDAFQCVSSIFCISCRLEAKSRGLIWHRFDLFNKVIGDVMSCVWFMLFFDIH